MKALRIVLPAMLGCLLASAADRELTGRVVDANTGEPIARAHLTIRFFAAGQPAPELTLLSDADGSFKITNVPDGQYQVSCDKAGYLPLSQTMAAMPPTIHPDDKRTSTMVMKLTAQAAVEGTVVDERDIPAVNASIQLVRQEVMNGRRQLQVNGGGSTDETGSFRIFGLPAGRYYVSVSARLGGTRRTKPLAYPPFYYPKAADLAAAQAIDLKAGDEAEIKIRLPEPMPAYQLSGVVVGAANAGVILMPQESSMTFQRSVGDLNWDPKTNSFRISHVPPGSYRLQADAAQPGKGQMFASVAVTVGSANVEGIRLELVDATLDGTLRMDESSSSQRVAGSVLAQSDRFNNMAQVDADGKFHIPYLQPGRYSIVPQIYTQQACLRSITAGGRDVRDGVTVTAGSAPDPIEITLTSHCGSVEVDLAASDAVLPPNLTASLLRKAGDELVLEKQGYPGPRTSDGIWHFMLQGVAPGDYVAYVWPSDAPIEYTNADYMKQLESYGQSVTVTEDGKATVTIDKPVLIPVKN
jgi:hypothetical protein